MNSPRTCTYHTDTVSYKEHKQLNCHIPDIVILRLINCQIKVKNAIVTKF